MIPFIFSYISSLSESFLVYCKLPVIYLTRENRIRDTLEPAYVNW